MIVHWTYGNKIESYHPSKRKGNMNAIDRYPNDVPCRGYQFPRRFLENLGTREENGVKDFAASPVNPGTVRKLSEIPKITFNYQEPSPKRGILKTIPKFQGPPLTASKAMGVTPNNGQIQGPSRTDPNALRVTSTKWLPFMKADLNSTTKLRSYSCREDSIS